MYTVNVSRPVSWKIAAILHSIIVFIVVRMHLPAIYATSHIDHEKKLEWFSISMHAYGSVPMVTVSTPLSNPFGLPEICY